jgi:acyl-CoA thioester hydrolase
MEAFRFYHPIGVRYADIDPQRHVNNARYFTVMEQARVRYVQRIGLWDGEDFDGIGFILAEQRCTYLAPISLNQQIEVGVRAARLGKKSFELVYSMLDSRTREELATGSTVLVAYDYRAKASIPIPASWRKKMAAFDEPLDE